MKFSPLETTDTDTVHCKVSTCPRKRNGEKEKWLFEEALQIAEKRRKVKGKGENERYT